MSKPRRILGQTFESRSIFEPLDAGSSLTFAAAGGGKTTCTALPTILSLLADRNIAQTINDVKSGEIAAQIAPVCRKHRRRFGIIDEFDERPDLAQYKVSLNPFGDLEGMARRGAVDLPFTIETNAHALIEEPKDDPEHAYWRNAPRDNFLELGTDILLEHNPRLAFPGGLYALISDPQVWIPALEIEAEEGDDRRKAAARVVLDMRVHNPEHYSQHLQAALAALKIFGRAPLCDSGRHPTLTYKQVIEEGWIICVINPARHSDRLGPLYALLFQSLLNAKLGGAVGRLELIIDEVCNAPMRDPINRVTIQRAYGVRSHFIAQSRQDLIRRYGEKETAILEENCTIKQWLKFSSFEEAERVSRAMGEGTNVSHGLGVSSDRNSFTGNFSTGKERNFTADQLMRLPPDEQILHVAGVGFIHCKKIRQNQLAPYCHELGDNPVEGGRLTPDPKVVLPTPEQGEAS
jgi:type IV secretion system protein VirD4